MNYESLNESVNELSPSGKAFLVSVVVLLVLGFSVASLLAEGYLGLLALNLFFTKGYVLTLENVLATGFALSVVKNFTSNLFTFVLKKVS